MFLAIAVLLIHPQLATTASLSVDKAAIPAPPSNAASTISVEPESFSLTAAASLDTSTQPAAIDPEMLPDALALMQTAPRQSRLRRQAFLKAGNPMTVSVAQLQAENRRKQFMWKSLVIASSGAATFDAWATRHTITTSGAQELNPLLKPSLLEMRRCTRPFRSGPVLLDFAGQRNDVQQALRGSAACGGSRKAPASSPPFSAARTI